MQVPNRFSASTRATDNDRVLICRTLDAGLADGQLSGAEHESRVSTAMHAKTVAELRAVVTDLQNDDPLPPPPPRAGASRTLFRLLVPAAATVLLLILLIALAGNFTSGGADEDDPDKALGSRGYLSLRGLTEVVDAIRTDLGTTSVDDLTIYEDYAVVETIDPQAPRLTVSHYYDGDFRTTSGSSRDPNVPPLDLTTIDLPKLAGIVAGIGRSVNLERVDDVYVCLLYTSDAADE